MCFWPESLGGASVALETVRKKRGHPVSRPDRLGSQGRHREVVWAGMSAGTEGLDGELRPLIPMGKEAVDAVLLTLLDHRGKPLEAEPTFAYGLVQVFSLRGAKVLRTAAKFFSKNGVDFFTFLEGPRGEDSDVCTSGVQALCHDKVNRPGARLFNGESADGDQKFLLHEL